MSEGIGEERRGERAERLSCPRCRVPDTSRWRPSVPSLFRSRPLCPQSPVPLRAQLTRAQLLLIRRGRSFYLSIHALVAPHVPLGRGSERVADTF